MFLLNEKLLPLVAVDYCLRKWASQFSLVKIWPFFKNWFPLILVTVPVRGETLSKRKRFSPSGMKDFVEK